MECIGLSRRYMLLLSSVCLTFISVILTIVGLCTNNWVELRERNLYRNSVTVHFGLHRICWVSNDRCNNAGNDYDQQNALPVAQGILITGGFMAVLAALASLFNLLQDRLGRSSGLISVANAAVCGISGIMLMVGVIVFAVRVKVRTEFVSVAQTDFLGYSFGLTTCAAIMMIIAAILSGLTGISSAEQKFNM